MRKIQARTAAKSNIRSDGRRRNEAHGNGCRRAIFRHFALRDLQQSGLGAQPHAIVRNVMKSKALSP
jgi:hypothetical protein